MSTTEELPEQPVLAPGQREQYRAYFLSEASRQLAGCLELRRTLLSALRVAVPQLAGWAQIALFEPRSTTLIARGAEPTEYPVPVDAERPSATHTGLGRLRRNPTTEQVRLDDPGQEPDAALRALVPDNELRAAALAARPVEAIGIPLVAREAPIGALVLVRTDERMDAEDLRLAEDVADRIALAIDVARIYEERAHMASVLQSSLRPPRLPRIDGVLLAARYLAAVEHIEIGGDFYDVHGADDDWTLAIGDVCGKGVEAAVLTGRSRQTIRTAAHLDRSPERTLAVLNEVLYEADSDRFVTAACARLRVDPDRAGATVDLATAGHPAPMLLRRDGSVSQVDVRGPLCGVLPAAEYEPCRVRLGPGDTLLFFTDGSYEARGPAGLYGMDRLARLLPGLAGAGPDELCAAVEASVMGHLAGQPHDDMALLAVTCAPG